MAIAVLFLNTVCFGAFAFIIVQMILTDQMDTDAIIFMTCMFLPIIALAILTSRFLAVVELNQKGVKLYIPFKKTVETPYEDYKYVQLGCYLHGRNPGMGYHRFFVVITKKWYEKAELQKVNLILNDENTVKIKLSKRRYNMLCEMLPKWQRNTLIRLVESQLGKT